MLDLRIFYLHSLFYFLHRLHAFQFYIYVKPHDMFTLFYFVKSIFISVFPHFYLFCYSSFLHTFLYFQPGSSFFCLNKLLLDIFQGRPGGNKFSIFICLKTSLCCLHFWRLVLVCVDVWVSSYLHFSTLGLCSIVLWLPSALWGVRLKSYCCSFEDNVSTAFKIFFLFCFQ